MEPKQSSQDASEMGKRVSDRGTDKPDMISFPNGNHAQLVAPPAGADAADILRALDLKQPEGLIIVAGSAKQFNKSQSARLAELFSRGVARAAAEADALILDGGTQAGVMALMGEAVADRGGKSLLLGVTPAGKATYPGGPEEDRPEDSAPLDPNHPHFVLAASDEWGGETETMFELAKALAGRALAGAAPDAQDETDASSAGIPVVMVLAGGRTDGIAKTEVLCSVRHGWPVIVIEGSGRLANEVARRWKKKRRRFKRVRESAAGLFKRFRTVDPAMAEIIEEGRITLFPLDGPAVEFRDLINGQFQQPKEDQTLVDAWRRFAVYDQNAITAQKRFLRSRKWILRLGVAATFLAVLHTVLSAIETRWVIHVNSLIRYLVIAAPILVSILLAGSVKFERGESWVLLRNSAEALKKEIYRYRTRVEIYKGETRGESERREVKLARKLKRIGERLMKTQVNQTGIVPYADRLPPQYGAAAGDDGFSDLDPKGYLKWRLEDQLNWYQGKAMGLDRQLQQLLWLIYILGGVGTFLAAVGLEIWIAVTVAIVGALTGFLELMRLETTRTAYNQAAEDLDSVRAWWHALPNDEKADEKRHDNFEKLVKYTETVIESEHAGWVQEMRDALAELYKETDADSPPPESGGEPDV
jgi:hypothetical protein